MTPPVTGQSSDREARGHMFMYSLRNPRNIYLLSGYPAGRTGDWGNRTEFDVLKFYVPFFVPRVDPKVTKRNKN